MFLGKISESLKDICRHIRKNMEQWPIYGIYRDAHLEKKGNKAEIWVYRIYPDAHSKNLEQGWDLDLWGL